MIQKPKFLKPSPKKTPEQQLVGITEREALHSYNPYVEGFSTERQPNAKLARFALNKGGIAPDFMHANRAVKSGKDAIVEVATLPDAGYKTGVTVDRKLPNEARDRYHIAFAPDQQAIVTTLGEPGTPLTPAEDPIEKIRYAQDALDEVISDKYKS